MERNDARRASAVNRQYRRRAGEQPVTIASALIEVAQAARLGPTLDDNKRKVYFSIAAEAEHSILTALWGRREKVVEEQRKTCRSASLSFAS
ncbi:hypothetical protein [Saccharothrix xinjiangensis]|uniref:Uncharacterized protein n=1 Tax=Saccharothrix xinjiangensis TaxID=204798 RepID=A0ABV9Y1J2_9PSEU